MTKRRSILPAMVLALTLALVAAACSDGDDDIDSGVASDETTGTSDTSETTDDSGTTESSATTSSSTTSTTDQGPTDTSGPGTTDLPGVPWDGFAQDGHVLSVFGVAHDDVLNVRAIPGTGGEIVATADPTADDLVATGRARQVPGSAFWYEVTVDGTTGWVSVSFVAYQAGTDDPTAEYLAGNERPEAETLEELGRIVAQGFASIDPPSDIVQSVAPSVGDLGEITFDVVGLGDDAGAGYRLHIFAVPPDETGDGFSLRTIERTEYCYRGSTGELCV